MDDGLTRGSRSKMLGGMLILKRAEGQTKAMRTAGVKRQGTGEWPSEQLSSLYVGIATGLRCLGWMRSEREARLRMPQVACSLAHRTLHDRPPRRRTSLPRRNPSLAFPSRQPLPTSPLTWILAAVNDDEETARVDPRSTMSETALRVTSELLLGIIIRHSRPRFEAW